MRAVNGCREDRTAKVALLVPKTDSEAQLRRFNGLSRTRPRSSAQLRRL